MSAIGDIPGGSLRLTDKIRQVHWGIVFLLCLVAAIGVADAYDPRAHRRSTLSFRKCVEQEMQGS